MTTAPAVGACSGTTRTTVCGDCCWITTTVVGAGAAVGAGVGAGTSEITTTVWGGDDVSGGNC